MMGEERRILIVEEINLKGSIRVNDLVEKFDVSHDCIRKDLTILEKKNLLKKTYGGAVSVRDNTHKFYVDSRKMENVIEKEIIAKKAVKLINDGDTIYLDISTSNLKLMYEIVKSNLKITVVSNMIDIISLGNDNVTIICAGGYLNVTHDGFTGTETCYFLNNYHFDKAFFGVVGFDMKNLNVYTYEANDGSVKKTVLNNSNETYLLGEMRKSHCDGNYCYAKLNQFNAIITEQELDSKLAESLSKKLVYFM
jgi:DeoR family glycerol-3-phosphate regulon repressor